MSMIFLFPLFAGDFEKGVDLYQNASQAESVEYFEQAAKNGDRRAQYQLAYMYENGIGVSKDSSKSAYWYKQVASELKQIPAIIENTDLSQGVPIKLQQNRLVDDAMKQFIFQTIDMPKEIDERESMIDSIFGGFGLFPYEKNFFLPLVYTTENYEKYDPAMFPGYDEYNKNIEMEFQLSMKKPVTFNLFGFNEIIMLAYTHELWWQYYADSSPFRETNYRPEVWVTVPMENALSQEIGFKAYKIGFMHESNGRGKPLSRSWNRIYADLIFQHATTLLTELRVWSATKSKENDDIGEYLGYGHLKLNYFLGKHQFNLTWRNNLRFNGDNRGSVEGEWPYPVGHSKSTFWYVKGFSGYGASLIEYNKQQNRIGFGFTFSR